MDLDLVKRLDTAIVMYRSAGSSGGTNTGEGRHGSRWRSGHLQILGGGGYELIGQTWDMNTACFVAVGRWNDLSGLVSVLL